MPLLLVHLSGTGASKGAVDLEEVADLALPDTMTTAVFAGELLHGMQPASGLY